MSYSNDDSDFLNDVSVFPTALNIVIFTIILSILVGAGQAIYIRTAGVEIQNAKREAFEHSNSYVRGKESDILRLFHEHQTARTATEKSEIRAVVRLMTKDFNEDLLNSQELKAFVTRCKYN